ncbi:MAG: class I SAM-dependent methyltransferase [Chthoniobacterales bacterium]
MIRPVQAWARNARVRFFLPQLHSGDRILEIGPGDGWFKKALAGSMRVDYVTIDVNAPADVRGDVREWRQCGLKPQSFDAIVAFEVVEHTPCFRECHDLLKSGGHLLITTPMPRFDSLLRMFENLHLTQKRTSEHTNLVSVKTVPGFILEKVRYPFGLGQWAVLRKVEPGWD